VAGDEIERHEVVAVRHLDLACLEIDRLDADRLVDLLHLVQAGVRFANGRDEPVHAKVAVAWRSGGAEVAAVGQEPPFLGIGRFGGGKIEPEGRVVVRLTRRVIQFVFRK